MQPISADAVFRVRTVDIFTAVYDAHGRAVANDVLETLLDGHGRAEGEAWSFPTWTVAPLLDDPACPWTSGEAGPPWECWEEDWPQERRDALRAGLRDVVAALYPAGQWDRDVLLHRRRP